MNKIKVSFVALAIFAGVGGAFATNCVQCDNSPQYVWNGIGYVSVGIIGEDYDCWVTGGVCTFYQPDPVGQPNVYAPCHTGGFTPNP
jgi:hypothetical protein